MTIYPVGKLIFCTPSTQSSCSKKMISIKSLLEKAQNLDFWKSLNPNLCLSENLTLPPNIQLEFEQAHIVPATLDPIVI